jgi:replicative DNA helicase
MGKSALGVDIASFLVGSGVPAGVFSLEMSEENVYERILAQRTRIPAEQMSRGEFSEEQFRIAFEHTKELGRLPLHIDEKGGLSIAKLASRARRMKRKHKIALLVIDYLQLAQGSGRENRTQDVTEITTGLKALAKELNIPAVVLSQLNRKVEDRADKHKRPQLSDLRDPAPLSRTPTW